jgi:hypothetical protein
LLAATPEAAAAKKSKRNGTSKPPQPRDPVFVAFDGGFVVGKQQQKHHVSGCRCPNCNNLRFRRENGSSTVVQIEKNLLFDLVGEEECFQRVLTAQTEIDRRAKIGAANKGKSAWNKGRHHTAETIAKIKANTAKAMRDPDVKRRMREAAAKTFHSATTKMKIRRTVRDAARKKMEQRNQAHSVALGLRRGMVGMVSIGTFSRRVSGVQRVSFGVWGKLAMDAREAAEKEELRAMRKAEREERRRATRDARLAEIDAKGIVPRTTRGVPKSPEHRAAISAALKMKWNDPAYVNSQRSSARQRRSALGLPKSSRPARESVPRAPPTEAEKKRHKLVGEMKEIYTKASVAVRALEERKSAGMEVDEATLKKALSAVSETRKVLRSMGQAAAPLGEPSAASAKAKAKATPKTEMPCVHVVDGEVVDDQGGEDVEDSGLDVA